MRRALFYLTYNGIYNFTNGIGTQTQLLLSGLERMQQSLMQQVGPFRLHVICPLPDQQTWGYDVAFFQQQRERLAALQAQLHLLPYKSQSQVELWNVATWHHLSAQAARLIHQQSQAYDACLLFCVDQPWLHTPRYLPPSHPNRPGRCQTLLVLYNTAFIRNAVTPNQAEMDWEYVSIMRACEDSQVAIADVCPSFTQHLRTFYDLPTARFAPYTSSILVDDDDCQPLTTACVTETLQRYAVPLDEDLIVAFGRATPIKGFDLLIPALADVRQRCHLVLISVPYPDDPYQQTYDRLLAAHHMRATHVRTFTRDLPRALCQWPRTRMVVVPSRQETFSNIPLEVALWARHQGPVVVASRVGGFVDQIDDGRHGFLFDINRPETITQTVQRVLALAPETLANIRRLAYEKVVQQYDFQRNFPRTLAWFWDNHTRPS